MDARRASPSGEDLSVAGRACCPQGTSSTSERQANTRVGRPPECRLGQCVGRPTIVGGVQACSDTGVPCDRQARVRHRSHCGPDRSQIRASACFRELRLLEQGPQRTLWYGGDQTGRSGPGGQPAQRDLPPPASRRVSILIGLSWHRSRHPTSQSRTSQPAVSMRRCQAPRPSSARGGRWLSRSRRHAPSPTPRWRGQSGRSHQPGRPSRPSPRLRRCPLSPEPGRRSVRR